MRKSWLAACTFILFWTVVNSHQFAASPLAWFSMVSVTALLCVMLTRFGLLATVSWAFCGLMLLNSPLTADLDAWYFGKSLFALGVVVAVGIYGET